MAITTDKDIAADSARARSEADWRILPITAQGVSIRRDGRRILTAVDLVLAPESGITVLLGPNGAGKSVLMRTLARLVQPDEGDVLWAGIPPCAARMRRIGYVFQRPVLLRRSVLANVEFALAATVQGFDTHDRRRAARDALALAGISHLEAADARTLSGGEQQRLALARALACRPELLILDEPTSNLDPASTAAIEKLLSEVRRQGVPTVFITHDLAQARRLADSVIFMHMGAVCEQAPAEVFFKAPRSGAAQAYLKGEIFID